MAPDNLLSRMQGRIKLNDHEMFLVLSGNVKILSPTKISVFFLLSSIWVNEIFRRARNSSPAWDKSRIVPEKNTSLIQFYEIFVAFLIGWYLRAKIQKPSKTNQSRDTDLSRATSSVWKF